MNATSMYVTLCRLTLECKGDEKSYQSEVCRLLPYLRQCLSCTVCGNLLVEPHTPQETSCQHHVCKTCLGGKKKLKPTCSWCKDYEKYTENLQLRSLLQCYKKLCDIIRSSPAYRQLSTSTDGRYVSELVLEGTGLKDVYKPNLGLSKSDYSILPCIYSSISSQIKAHSAGTDIEQEDAPSPENGSSLYSVMYAGTGNKMVIKRKVESQGAGRLENVKNEPESVKRPSHRRSGKTRHSRAARESEQLISKTPEKKQRFGCRCGNATVTPGKLTCCGQRCPCYVVSKACMDCKCRGCRNPHTIEGQKVLRDVGRSRRSDSAENSIENEILQMGDLDDSLGNLDQVLDIRSDAAHDLDLL